MWNVTQDTLLTLKPKIYWFCILLLPTLTGTESLKPCIQLFAPIKKKFFGSNLFQKKVAAEGNSLEATW